MGISLKQLPLMAHLKSLDDMYYGKIFELRNEVQEWLSYIPGTFPHYTRHSIKHSDEIVIQVSKLLFKDDTSPSCIRLSAAEIYILIAAAYLHDSGMVAADKEKLEILTSNTEWKNWTSGEGGGARRWREIEEIRNGLSGLDQSARNFVADLQTRYLLAEFIRRIHHLRAADVIKQFQDHLGRFAFGDPMMQATIADICIAHGLQHYELEDREKYPERRDIQGYSVNVRLLAILLRLGDLLDMSYDRACPLLMNAANPLPADSIAHWTQYQRIKQRATTPDIIEIIAECQTQEEHRVLQDWCQWIVDEVRHARVLINRSELYRDWQPPAAILEGPSATIKIRPASNATYIPAKWTFEFDHTAVIQLLMRDVYSSPLVFIRELIQNALDANRCQMYMDLAAQGEKLPDYPTQVNDNHRRHYPVEITLESRHVLNEMSNETEERQVLIIEDNGIGMDNEIIKRYFLQIGRSYYMTDEFRRKFPFAPTSRFGVGFLSVFAVSDNVVVETYKPSSPSQDGPVRLTLTGPRNYLLTEVSSRRRSGTKVEVLLREPLEKGEITKLISQWCPRVELSIVINDMGLKTTIVAEKPEQFITETPSIIEQGAKFVIRAFPINRPGIEGELYLFAEVNEIGERWDRWTYAKEYYLRNHPQATIPELPGNLVCLHGIFVSSRHLFERAYTNHMRARIDYRSNKFIPELSRETTIGSDLASTTELISRYEEILNDHLASSPFATSEESWKYKNSLARYFQISSFWHTIPGMIPINTEGNTQYLSSRDVQDLPVITTIFSMKSIYNRFTEDKSDYIFPLEDIKTPIISGKDLRYIARSLNLEIFKNRSPLNFRLISNKYISFDWVAPVPENHLYLAGPLRKVNLLAELPEGLIAIHLDSLGDGYNLLNINHPFIKWLRNVSGACMHGEYELRADSFDIVLNSIDQLAEYTLLSQTKDIEKYLESWLQIPNLPAELYPPFTKFTANMFMLPFSE